MENPALRVIVRSKSEETVLAVCKYASVTPSSPTVEYSNCRKASCQACQKQSTS